MTESSLMMTRGSGEDGQTVSTEAAVNQLFVLKRKQLGLRREMLEGARLASASQDLCSPPRPRLVTPPRPEETAWEPAASMVDPSRRRGYSRDYSRGWNDGSVSDAAQHTMCASSNTVTVGVGAVMAMLARQQYLMSVLEKPGAGGGREHAGTRRGDEGMRRGRPAVPPSKVQAAAEQNALRERAASLQQQSDSVDAELASKLEAVAQANAKVKQLQAHLSEIQGEEMVPGSADLQKQQKLREDNFNTSIQSTLESTEQLRAEKASVHVAIEINRHAVTSAQSLIEQQRKKHHDEVCHPHMKAWLCSWLRCQRLRCQIVLCRPHGQYNRQCTNPRTMSGSAP